MIYPYLITVKFFGAYQKQDFKRGSATQLKKNTLSDLHFSKRFLEVSNKASNVACRGELGRVSINLLNRYLMKKFLTFIEG